MPKKVLLISDSYPPSFGGVARHVYTLSKFYSKIGLDVTVLTPAIEEQVEEVKDINVQRTLNLSPKKRALDWPILVLKNSQNLVKTILKTSNDYDYIHYHGTNSLYLDKIPKDISFTHTLHGIFPACIFFQEIDNWCGHKPSSLACSLCVAKIRKSYIPLLPGMMPFSGYYYKRMKYSMKHLEKIISVSDYVKKITEEAYNLSNITTLYNFIDIEDDILHNLHSPGKNSVSLEKNGEIHLLYSGGLKYSKGILPMLEAYDLLKNKIDVKLILSGIGPYKAKIEELAKNDENIKYLGFLDRPTQIKTLNEIDIFLAPSIYPDACPTSILEAMALGKPVVATKTGGIPELVLDGVTGQLADPNNAYQLCEKVLKMVETGSSSYKQACINQARKFDIKKIGPKIIKLYESLGVWNK